MKHLIKPKKITLMSALFAASLIQGAFAGNGSTSQNQQEGMVPFTSALKLKVGFEFKKEELEIPCGVCAATGKSSSRTGSHDVNQTRYAIEFEGLNLDLIGHKESDGALSAVFIPSHITMTENSKGNAFGDAPGVDGKVSPVLYLTGTLAQFKYVVEGTEEVLRVVTSIVSVQYDRDSGLTEWKAIEAGLEVAHIIKSDDAEATLSLDALTSFGGMHLNFGDAAIAATIPAPIAGLTENIEQVVVKADAGFSVRGRWAAGAVGATVGKRFVVGDMAERVQDTQFLQSRMSLSAIVNGKGLTEGASAHEVGVAFDYLKDEMNASRAFYNSDTNTSTHSVMVFYRWSQN